MISIITPVKNGEKYLRECIESVMREPETEHVIVDGGSQDNTYGIVQDLQRRYGSRIIYIYVPGKGIGESWNIGILLANGDILGWLGHDDILYPGAGKVVSEYFQKYFYAKACYGKCEVINADGTHKAWYPTERFNWDRLLNKICFIACTSMFYRKSVFNLIGMVDNYGSDYELWLRMATTFPIYYLEVPLSKFRIHDKNNSKVNGSDNLKRVRDYSRRYGGKRYNAWEMMYLMTQIKETLKPIEPAVKWAYPIGSYIIRRILPSDMFKGRE